MQNSKQKEERKIQKIGIIGDGKFASAMSYLLATENSDKEVLMWTYKKEYEVLMRETGVYRKFKMRTIPSNVVVTSDAQQVANTDILFFLLPAQCTQSVLSNGFRTAIKNHWGQIQGLVSGTKGFVVENGKRMEEVYREIFGSLEGVNEKYAAFAGPNFAMHIINGSCEPTLVAAQNRELCEKVKHLFGSKMLTSVTDDVAGVEIIGALKNVIAISVGMAQGLGLDTEIIQHLILAGAAEIKQFALVFGAKKETFQEGSPVMTDLFMTCSDSESRNFATGFNKTNTNPEKIMPVRGTAEGLQTVKAVMAMAEKKGIEVPICRAVYRMLEEGADREKIMNVLVARLER